MTDKPIDVEATTQTQALAVRDTGGAVGYALSLEELHRNLQFVRDVMSREMREGQDFGKIPGTGDRPTLLQPGAQKLLLTFNLTECVKREVMRDFPNFHREYEFTVTVRAMNGKEWDGVGTCSTLEGKYRFRKVERQCPECGKHTIIAGKEEFGGGWLCWKKRGGCGSKFQHNDQRIQGQQVGRMEHDNPPDYWNTVRKMAFKRALVAAAINATNTSDLWTQDLEERESEEDTESPTVSAGQATASRKPERVSGQRTEGSNATEGKLGVKSPKEEAPKVATEATRAWMIEQLKAAEGQEGRRIVSEFFTKVDALLPGAEQVEDLPLEYVPTSKAELLALMQAIAAFEAGEPAAMPYKHPMQILQPKPKTAEVDGAERAIDPKWEIVEGRVERTSMKEGKKKDGSAWSLWGIKVGEQWYNTFSNRVGQFAQEASRTKATVKLYYTRDDEGRMTAEEIE